MLVTTQELLTYANRGRFAIPAFNTYDQYLTRGIIRGAENVGAPIMLALGTGTLKSYGAQAMVNMISAMALEARIPISVHLDHASSMEYIVQWFEAGAHSAMIDGSKLEREKNIELTRDVAVVVHRWSGWLEAELGRIDGSENVNISKQANAGSFTNPQEAHDFIAQTKVDALAVSIGNVHGRSSANIRLDLTLLEQIASVVNIPLVLHGASGVPLEQIQQAIALGVRKINFNFDIRTKAMEVLREASQHEVQSDSYNLPRMYEAVEARVASEVSEKCRMVGAASQS
ncbi:MAG TPA: class II fructose-bisphosphate aldolase [Ktedonobacteraceae bacterium]